jgi:ATPase subunit of ABC transporter with duplicated ATPase domains
MSPIVCSHLSFRWPDDTPLFEDLSFTVPGGRTGLVAPNGVGKSTLLRLLAGELRATAGGVAIEGRVGYLPQNLPFDADRTVADVLGVAPVVAALDALAAGDASDAVFAAIGDDWDVEDRLRAHLDRLGLSHVTLNRTLGSLSGGEVVAVGLAAHLLRRPDVLLLDEPTNNLDADARQRLHGALDGFAGALLVVSHDRELLDRMDRIAELHRGEIIYYGGTFTDYENAVEAARHTAEADVRNAEQLLKRERREMQQARERAARRSSTAVRNVKDAGLPKIVAGKLKRDAQESAAKADDVHAKRVDGARTRLELAERTLRDDDAIVVDLPDTDVPAGRTVLVVRGLRYRIGDRELFTDRGINMDIGGPERVALTGANGSGKSTLLRIVYGDLEPSAGDVQRTDGRIAYLSQRLDVLEPERTVAENLAAFAPGLGRTRHMHLLAQFRFRDEHLNLPVGALSGGERLRATLACVLNAEPAPQLLLLDEPTNNLDLVSVRQLETALNAYRGAFIVVSHDERFLDAIGVARRLRLVGGEIY